MGMRKIYRKIAKENGISAKEVRQEIQSAIVDAYTNPLNDNEITKAYQQRIPSRDRIPTPEEVIRYVSGQVTKKF